MSVSGGDEIQVLLRDEIMVTINQGTQEYLNPTLVLPSLCFPKRIYVQKTVAKEGKCFIT